MKVNFLKRLESSIESFEISMERTIGKVKELEERIKAYRVKEPHPRPLPKGEGSTPPFFGGGSGGRFYEIEAPEIYDDDDTDLNDANSIGKKLKFHLDHLDLELWLADLKSDKDALVLLKTTAKAVTPDRDKKLTVLKELIQEKLAHPINDDNKKVIVFTAFSDTAYYLYNNLVDFARDDLGLHIALVTGSGDNKTTLGQRRFTHILTNFSPRSKSRAKIQDMPQDEEIDILIATDCISEGQNLQDCDYLINYDIHWNPVRIIQRFGRIDRLGSTNECLQLVNFWPTEDLNTYINLKGRVEARMALVDIAATGEENLLEAEQIHDLIEEDLTFRDRQLLKLQKEVLDLEDLDENISLSEFTLDDFRIELSHYIEKNKQRLHDASFGMYAVVPSPSGEHAHQSNIADVSENTKDIIKPGVIYCLRQKGNTEGHETVNPLSPYFLVYIRKDGTVRFNYTYARQILEVFRVLTSGVTQPYEELCDLFNSETADGSDMDEYNDLLHTAIDDIHRIFTRRASLKLTRDRGALLIPKATQTENSEHFELITWLVII